MEGPHRGAADCSCTALHDIKLIVVTGGPGGGKTALLELARRDLCRHVIILPEAAGLLYSGGFPRREDGETRRAAQRAIYHVQRELEAAALAEDDAAVVLCDRGTLDSAAYWPSAPEDLWRAVGTTQSAELARYSAVLHMRTPPVGEYNHQNPLRIESVEQALAIDERVERVWSPHPRRFVFEHELSFLDKAATALATIRNELPACCRR